MSVLVWTVSLTALSILGFGAWKSWSNYQKYKSLRSLPSPSGGNFLFGNLKQLLDAGKKGKYFELLSDWAEDNGSMYVFWALGEPTVILTKPKLIEETVVRGMKDGSLTRDPKIKRLWGDLFGRPVLVEQDGQEWLWRRQDHNKSLNQNSLNFYLETISLGCKQIIEQIEVAAKNERVVQVDPIFAELTMSLISYFLLGIPLDRKSPSHEGPPLEKDRLYQAFSILTKQFTAELSGENQWLKYLPTKSGNSYWNAKKYLADFIAPRADLALQIAQRKPKRTTEKISQEFENSMLVHLAKQSKFTEEMLCSEAKMILFAGTDTTSHTLSFIVGALGLNPLVFEKARQEVDRVWNDFGEINSESWKKLDYLQGVIKEAMRLYPVSNGSSGCIVKTATVIDKVHIPEGTKLSWAISAASRDPDEYSNPNEFIPERWLKDEQQNKSPLTILVFGSGPHRCLGESLAILEATVMLAMLIRHFDWEVVNGRDSLENLRQNLAVFPSDRMPIRFKAREFAKPTVILN